MKPEVDEISGVETTGHNWDGIKELNTPVPKVFRICLWGTIFTAILLWILYPAWPYVTDYSRGILGYSSRTVVNEQVAEGVATRAAAFEPFETQDVATLATDPSLRATYGPSIKVLYDDNCAACHGRDLKGQHGFPDLTDAHWLWSGTPEGIEHTLNVGINSTHKPSQYGEMQAYGADGLLDRAQRKDVVEYVLNISGSKHDAEAAARGLEVFDKNCVSCHMEGGVGGKGEGAPSLVDDAWIYGSKRKDIEKIVYNGSAGLMPFWSERLTPAEIRKLTLYVLWAGEGDG